jgi:hypothetical protein
MCLKKDLINFTAIYVVAILGIVSCTSNPDEQDGSTSKVEVLDSIDIIEKDSIATKEASYEELSKIILENELIPMRYFANSKIFPVGEVYEVGLKKLGESKKFMVGKISSNHMSQQDIQSEFICVFSKKTGLISSFISLGTESMDASPNVYSIRPQNEEYTEFMLIKKVYTIIASEEGMYVRDQFKNAITVFYYLSWRGDLLAKDDTLNISYEELVELIDTKSKIPPAYLHNLETDFNQGNEKEFYLEYVAENDEYLLAVLKINYLDENGEIDSYRTDFCSFAKDNGILLSSKVLGGFSLRYQSKENDYLIKSFDKNKNNKFQIDVKNYSLTWSDEANMHINVLSDSISTIYYVHNNGELLTYEPVNLEDYGFLDFIERVKDGRDVRTYQDESYYYDIMEVDYGGPARP